MANFVFIHSSFTAAWCWRDILTRLESRRHKCIALDMPGHGKNSTPPEDVAFEDYLRAVIHAVEPLPEPPVLVGHSMTSIISQVAERIPSRIRALVYVAGFLLPNGHAMLEAVDDLDPEYLAQLIWSPDRKTACLSPDGAAKLYFQLCSPSVIKEIVPLLTPEPVAPFEARLRITDANFGRVPRYYVECERDRIIPVSVQRRMHSAIPCKRVYTIDTDHAPFFSAPAELSSILLEIAEAESPLSRTSRNSVGDTTAS